MLLPTPPKTPSTCHYYVDEAGDTNIFNQRGKVIIGSEGCSTHFLLGFLDIPNPELLSSEMHELRQNLLSDPYFKNVPSMQPNNRKMAIAFHAKDDIPEVRREVFKLLSRYKEVKFFATVKNKHEELAYINQNKAVDPAYKYQPNQLYEYLTWRMFKGCLHNADEYRISFASRGNSDRTQALKAALEIAQQKSKVKKNASAAKPIHVQVMQSKTNYGLQAVDYYSWALMRFYEKREDRYLDYLWSQFKVVVDLSDKRKTGAGMHYSQKRRLSLTSI